MDETLKGLMQELGNAINESLSDSDRIAAAIGEIKKAGYDVFLVLEATIGFNKRDESEDSDEEEHSAATPGEPARREDALQQTLKSVAETAMEAARNAAELFEKLGQLEALAAPSIFIDIRAGRSMAAAAAQGALESVAVNLRSVADPEFSRKMKADAHSLKSRIMEQPAGADKL